MTYNQVLLLIVIGGKLLSLSRQLIISACDAAVPRRQSAGKESQTLFERYGTNVALVCWQEQVIEIEAAQEESLTRLRGSGKLRAEKAK